MRVRIDIQQRLNLKSREKLSITKFLTRRHITLLIKARKAFGFFNRQTLYGTVYCIHHDKRQKVK